MTSKVRKEVQKDLQKALLQPSLGKRLQAVRKALGLTGMQVVDRVDGLNRSTLSEIENDVSRRTSYLTPLAKLYGLSEETLLRPDLGSLVSEETLGERIRRRREELNYTRSELADAIPGLTYHTVFMIEEKGRQSEYSGRIATFLGLHRREEETNASALLRLVRSDLFMDSTTFADIAACDQDAIARAEDGDTAEAVRLMLDLMHGLVQGRGERSRRDDADEGLQAPDGLDLPYAQGQAPIGAVVYDVDDSGRLSLPEDRPMPTSIAMPDGLRLYAAAGSPAEGEYALAISPEDGARTGIVGTYRSREQGAALVDPSNISHRIPSSMSVHRLLPFDKYLQS